MKAVAEKMCVQADKPVVIEASENRIEVPMQRKIAKQATITYGASPPTVYFDDVCYLYLWKTTVEVFINV